MSADLSYTLSKSLPQLVLPLGASLFLLLVALFIGWKKPRLARICSFTAFTLLTIFSLPVTSHLLIYKLENFYPTHNPKNVSKVDAIVLLGGGISPAISPRPYSQLGPGADRLLLTHKLYMSGKADRILLIGGPGTDTLNSDAEETRDILKSWGIPDNAFIIDKTTLNTEQNAEVTKRIIEQNNISSSYLVTSASHMLRAKALFNHQNIETTAMPADHWVGAKTHFEPSQWIPSATNLAGSSIVLREYLGIAYYVLTNRLDISDIVPRSQ